MLEHMYHSSMAKRIQTDFFSISMLNVVVVIQSSISPHRRRETLSRSCSSFLEAHRYAVERTQNLPPADNRAHSILLGY